MENQTVVALSQEELLDTKGGELELYHTFNGQILIMPARSNFVSNWLNQWGEGLNDSKKNNRP